jgi:hypothetical protein
VAQTPPEERQPVLQTLFWQPRFAQQSALAVQATPWALQLDDTQTSPTQLSPPQHPEPGQVLPSGKHEHPAS